SLYSCIIFICCVCFFYFFFSSRRRHTRSKRDWSSDVCSSDLADVLMLDDIGAETQSAWFRDDILGSILQYRMMEQLPVFFTSNYTMDQLETILSTTSKGGIEEVKAGRIMERIKQVS